MTTRKPGATSIPSSALGRQDNRLCRALLLSLTQPWTHWTPVYQKPCTIYQCWHKRQNLFAIPAIDGASGYIEYFDKEKRANSHLGAPTSFAQATEHVSGRDVHCRFTLPLTFGFRLNNPRGKEKQEACVAPGCWSSTDLRREFLVATKPTGIGNRSNCVKKK